MGDGVISVETDDAEVDDTGRTAYHIHGHPKITEPPPKSPPTYREKHRIINSQKSQNLHPNLHPPTEINRKININKSQNLRPNLHPPTERNIETLTPSNHRTSAQTSTHLDRETGRYLTFRNEGNSTKHYKIL